jgi:hypothetical protein
LKGGKTIDRELDFFDLKFPKQRVTYIPGIDDSKLLKAFVDPTAKRIDSAIEAIIVTEHTIPQPNVKSAGTVVFLLHGIRAGNAGWVESLERILKKADPEIQVVAPTYGRFSAARFPFALLRRGPVHSFESSYFVYRAKFPGATVHFMGHSYGTYVLGKSLQQISSMRFERVCLMATVLPRKFNWMRLLENGQIGFVRNDCANLDIPVGILCASLRGLGVRDVGTAGTEGFEIGDTRVREIRYHPGGHGAALNDQNLSSCANFLLTGVLSTDQCILTELRHELVALCSRACVYASPILLLGFCYLVWLVSCLIAVHFGGAALMTSMLFMGIICFLAIVAEIL